MLVTCHFGLKKIALLSSFLSLCNIIHILYRKRRYCRYINKNIKNHPYEILLCRKDLIFLSVIRLEVFLNICV